MNAYEYTRHALAEYRLGWADLVNLGRLVGETIRPGQDVAEIVGVVERAQERLGVTADGKAGPKTVSAMRHEIFAIPRGRAELERLHGRPKWRRVQAGKRAVRFTAGKPPIVLVTLHTGQTVRLHASIAGEFVAIYREACEASGYTPKSVVGYVARTIELSDDLSIHAYGLAVDFDPLLNPWGGRQRNGKPSLLRQHPEFVEVFERHGWTWGGRWKSGRGDDMHVQRLSVS